MTPAEEFREARRKLGLSQNRAAAILRVESGRTVRRWENGERDVPGPALTLMRVLLGSAQARRIVGL